MGVLLPGENQRAGCTTPALLCAIRTLVQAGNSGVSTTGQEFHSERERIMQFITVRIEKPEEINFIFGQTHFIKSVEDIHESLVSAVPGIRFGMAFCEASGKCLVRWSGTDPDMIELARKNAQAISAGHSFIIFLGPAFIR